MSGESCVSISILVMCLAAASASGHAALPPQGDAPPDGFAARYPGYLLVSESGHVTLRFVKAHGVTTSVCHHQLPR